MSSGLAISKVNLNCLQAGRAQASVAAFSTAAGMRYNSPPWPGKIQAGYSPFGAPRQQAGWLSWVVTVLHAKGANLVDNPGLLATFRRFGQDIPVENHSPQEMLTQVVGLS